MGVVAAGNPFGIAVADGYVVWADSYGKSIWVRDSSGALTEINGDQETARVSIHDGFVYWTEFNGPSLYRAKAPSGERELVAKHEGGASGGLGQLAVSGSGAYWTHEGPTPAVLSIALDAQTTTPVSVVPEESVDGIAGVAVDSEYVYWKEGEGILRKPLNGVGNGLAGELVSGASGVIDLGVDATHVYWFDNSFEDAHVWRAPKDGSGEATDLAESSSRPTAMVLDDLYVYWTRHDGAVYRVPKEGGQAKEMVPEGGRTPVALAQDCAALYWTTNDDNGAGEVRIVGK